MTTSHQNQPHKTVSTVSTIIDNGRSGSVHSPPGADTIRQRTDDADGADANTDLARI